MPATMAVTCFGLSGVLLVSSQICCSFAASSVRARRRTGAKRARGRIHIQCISRKDMDPDDLPEVVGDGDEPPTELTLSQELLMKSYVEQIERMTKDECDDLAIEIIRQSLVKDNLLRMMGVKAPADWLAPPNPEDFLKEKRDDGDDKESDKKNG